MTIKIIYVIHLFFLFFGASCSTANKMYDTVAYKKLFNQLYETNGNAFYTTSTHITEAFVWSYSIKEVAIYKLSKGRVVDKKTFTITRNSNWLQQFYKDDLYEVDTCTELDGDIFGIKLNKDNNVEEKHFAINLNCFEAGEYKSSFLKQVATDITTYSLKW